MAGKRSNTPPLTHREKFLQWHQSNPEVYAFLKEKALEAKRRGIDRYGAKALAELARFHFKVETPLSEFKLNNNFVAFYARLLMEDVPELAGFFELRKVRS